MKRLLMGALAVLLLFGGVPGAFAQSIPAAFLLYPNYRGLIFSDRPEILVEAPSGAVVTVRDKVTGSTVATATSSGAPVKIASSTLTQDHPYTVTVTQSGTTLNTWDVTPVPAAKRDTMNVSFSPQGRLVVHGAPRFLLGVYDNGHPYSTDPTVYEQRIFAPGGNRELEGININFYLNYHYGEATLQPMQVLMDVLQKRDIMYLQTGNCFSSGSYTRIPFSIDANDTYPTELGKHKGSAGYYIMDECTDALIPETKQHHTRLAGLDPDSITFGATFANGFNTLDDRKWVEAVDLLGTDPYPLYGAEPAAGYSHFQVADTVAMTNNAQRYTRPTVGVLQFFKFTSNSRWPTYAEERAHAIMSIVEGAQGLFWWEIGQNGLQKADAATKAAQMANLKSIVNELAALEAVLVAPDVPSALTGNTTRYADPIAGRIAQLNLSISNSWLWSAKQWYTAEKNRLLAGDTSLSPLAKGTADIRTKVKVVDGKGYVFAYNYTNKTLPVTFTWQHDPGTVTENKTGTSYPVSGSSWSDSFGPYESRIYVIASGTPPPPPPPAVTVAFTNPAAGATVSGTQTVSLSATGGSGTGYNYKLSVDGTQVYAGTNPSFSWNTTTVSNASHTLTGSATDSAGASGTVTRTVTVSNTVTPPPPPPPPPASFTVAFSNPTADGVTAKANLSVGNSTTAPWGQSKTWTLTVDGQTLTTVTNTNTVNWYTFDTKKVANGLRTLKMSVTSNGSTASVTRTINVANGTVTPPPPPPPPSAPTASFTSPAAGATVSGTTTVGLSSSGGATGSRTFKLEQVVGTTTTVLSTQTVTGTSASFAWNTVSVANGSVTLKVTVTDSAGASATTSRTVTVSNVVTPPPATFTATVTAPAQGATVRGTMSIGTTTTAPWGKSKTFVILVDGKVVKTQTITGTTLWFNLDSRTLTNGTHTIVVKVTYNGATATSPSRSVKVSN